MSASLRDGRWTLGERLGEGSQGTTWAALDRDGRRVAIKRFDVRGARSWKDVELAEREARVLGQLSHPKLPAYVEHFEEDGALYLVMQLMEGESLASRRKRGATLSEAEVFRFLADAADVLDYLHGRAPPVIHRDLKPGNVIRRPDGSFAFVDFGAVRDKLRPEGGSTVVGTFGYMAPEQFQGRAQPASDVYAIGGTAIAMLTGKEPESLPHKGLSLDVRAALGPRANERLVGVLTQMLEPDPDKRATRIAPLLASRPAARTEAPRVRPSSVLGDLDRELSQRFSEVPKVAEKLRQKTERWLDEEARRLDRRADKRREREERHTRRADKRRAREEKRALDRDEWRRDHASRRIREWSDPPPPWIGGFIGFHVLQLVRLFLFFVLRFTPMVVLSLLGLKKASQAVREWYDDVVDGELVAAQTWLRGGYLPPRAEEGTEVKVRVEPAPKEPLRVADEEPPHPEEEAEAPRKKARR